MKFDFFGNGILPFLRTSTLNHLIFTGILSNLRVFTMKNKMLTMFADIFICVVLVGMPICWSSFDVLLWVCGTSSWPLYRPNRMVLKLERFLSRHLIFHYSGCEKVLRRGSAPSLSWSLDDTFRRKWKARPATSAQPLVYCNFHLRDMKRGRKWWTRCALRR